MINKTTTWQLTCSLAGLTFTGQALGQSAESRQQQRPNIIFILADDLGIGDISPYGQRLIRTPHLQQLADEGMTFTQCYAGTAVSAPSRASLMTGKHTGHTYIRGNKGADPEGQVPMEAGTYTLAEMFRNTGYATGCFGKWGLGYPGSVSDPTKVGFDRFYGYNCQTLAHDYYPDHLWDNDRRVELPMNRDQQEGVYSADMIHRKALDFIRQNSKRPFFAYLSYTLPHAELRLPEDSTFAYYARLIPDRDEKAFAPQNPNARGAYGPQRRPLAAFAAMVTRLDRYVGDVMQLLRELGIDRNTILIFTSDNGPHREGGANPDYFDSYAQFRGIKRDLYEGGIRVPMIIRCPGTIVPGSKSEHIMAFWDMMPTFAELAGGRVKGHVDGISFVPSLTGNGCQREHDSLYWEFHEQGGKQAVRMGRWKGVRLMVDEPTKTRFELYDLETDQHEDHNLAGQHPDIVKKMLRRMKKEHEKSELFEFGSSAPTR